ncbi:MAG: methylmalonyl-CoA mutase family protein [Pseudomonadota bacterium]|nr:methylmalonyl-CoA mutase family protein [Pseudomonadota bacterium]
METARFIPTHKVRIVTAASLFDGHDASINIMRRVLQAGGAEVIHLGHNRSVSDVVDAAIQEDAQAIALSSYQGGHMEYFRYMRQLLDERGATHVKIFAGGGGVIVPEEIRALQGENVAERIYSPEDGRRLGLQGIINDLLRRADFDVTGGGTSAEPELAGRVIAGDVGALARAITWLENERAGEAVLPEDLRELIEGPHKKAPVLGITGTGGAGKSSLTDELVRRFRFDFPDRKVAVLSIDPTRRRTGGALLGDRIRMNALDSGVFMRSLATRAEKGELSAATAGAVRLCAAAGYDLVIVETSGIGQGDMGIVDLADVSLYVMTPEYGAASQLEKIDMLDNADVVVLNKFERRGAEDALRDVRKQVKRNRELFTTPDEALPVFGTIASQFNDPGVNAVYRHLLTQLDGLAGHESRIPDPGTKASPPRRRILPPERTRYLGEIVDTSKKYRATVEDQAGRARKRWQLAAAAEVVDGAVRDAVLAARDAVVVDAGTAEIVERWPAHKAAFSGEHFVYTVRGKEIRQPLRTESLSRLQIPRISVPRFVDHGEVVRWCGLENFPGHFPYTAGVFPLKRQGEDPKRMFAGEGGPARTNARFHYLCQGEPAKRLSTAFDSVTLYGEDPHERPDIFGKVGESGVSVPTLDDMKILYSGFDLCDPSTSVSMTINGPAPILLAMFFNTAVDQQVDRFVADHDRAPTAEEHATIQARTLSTVRGTVQADILKEDQAQNTCIFSTEFALKLMGDIQEYFVRHDVRNYYSVSISGYHIAEAGANPISQLAFTLANGFTFVEYYLARGMKIDDFAPNLSFFFSNGLDPEYTVIGRVARRIWSVVMREKYGADERSQKLKYHVQTSGRSLHAREIQFNDIRTTLQALLALFDNCNSLHTNAYDEAVTTPTEESVRRAMAIQMIINKELGWARNENPLQGSFFVDELTDLVEDAVLGEFSRIDARGGVLGAMETQYQRGKIQEESLYYEEKKHDGSLPIVGINTYQDPSTLGDDWEPAPVELRRATNAEKQSQIDAVRRFQAAHADEAPAALERLRQAALAGENLFAELMSAVRVASLGQITATLYEVGGAYRRNL